jgi:hypothetical protein
MSRLVVALGIVHAQGLVHGQLSADTVMTEGADEPDFQLTGFEWSLWVGADRAERAQAKLGEQALARRAELYSFAEDWRAAARQLGIAEIPVMVAAGWSEAQKRAYDAGTNRALRARDFTLARVEMQMQSAGW